MSNRTIKHEIKLQPTFIIILGILALGVGAIAFSSMFSVKKADAAFGGGEMITSTSNVVHQLKDGKIRSCVFYASRETLYCTDWQQ